MGHGRAAFQPLFLFEGQIAYGLTGPPTYSACSHLPTIPPMMPPTMGATQNSHSDCKAVAPPNTAVAVERAGLREALDTGIATRCKSTNARPMAIGADTAP